MKYEKLENMKQRNVYTLDKNDDKSLRVYVDTNNNEDLTDETFILYKMYDTPEAELKAKKELKPIKVNYEYFDGSFPP